MQKRLRDGDVAQRLMFLDVGLCRVERALPFADERALLLAIQPLRSRRLTFDQFHVLGRVAGDQTRRPRPAGVDCQRGQWQDTNHVLVFAGEHYAILDIEEVFIIIGPTARNLLAREPHRYLLQPHYFLVDGEGNVFQLRLGSVKEDELVGAFEAALQ